jgi:hypothetical protein
MAKSNPLIRKKETSYTTAVPNQSAGILDDTPIRKTISTKQGTINHVPAEDFDIANKKYVDDTHVPAGSDGEIQFNDSGVFGSDPTLFWDDVNKTVSIGDQDTTITVNGTTFKERLVSHMADQTIINYRAGGHSNTPLIAPNMYFNKSRGTEASPSVVADDDRLGIIQFGGHDGTDYITGASIQADVDGTPGSDDMPTRLVFCTTAAGDATPSERVTIKNDGKVGIGTNSPAVKFHVLGVGATPNIFRFNDGAGNVTPTIAVSTDQASHKAAGLGAGTNGAFFLYDESGFFVIGHDEKAKIEGGTSSVNKIDMTIRPSGNVGIGITTPQEKLAIGNGGNMVMDKASGTGIKVDNAAPTFGFADLLGDQFGKNTGATKPTLASYNGVINAWQFGAGDEAYMSFHIPHDHVPGTDIFLHIHWSHIGTFVTGGTVTFKATTIYAKGHNQAAFTGTPAAGTFQGTASTTQYQHIITETQYSDPSPSGIMIDTDLLEPDGVIEMTLEVDANDITVSEGAVPDPFIHFVDIHYQTTGLIGTKQKAPDFYT